MKERPILMSGEMVRQILAGVKTQTRRPIKSPAKNMQRAGMQVIKHREPDDPWYGDHVWSMRNRHGVWGDYTHERFLELCPYGVAGDRLWARETFCCDDFRYPDGPRAELLAKMEYRADHDCREWEAGCPCHDENGRSSWRPSIFMPRWAARLTLDVLEVRVERLHDISEEDIAAEGVTVDAVERMTGMRPMGPRGAWKLGWSHIYGAESWAANPWLWVVSFRRVQS